MEDKLTITYSITIKDASKLETISVYAGFSENITVESVEVNFNNISELEKNSSDSFSTTFAEKIIIDNYEKPEILDDITFSEETELNLKFDLPHNLTMDLTNVNIVSDAAPSGFNLGNQITGGTNNEASVEIFSDLYEMLDNENTSYIKIEDSSFDLSSSSDITINENTKLGMKSISFANVTIKEDIQIEPQSVETLSKSEINDVKKGLENIKLVIEGITNELGAEIFIQPYLASLPDLSNSATESELKSALYVDENKLVDRINIEANSSNKNEEIIIGHEEMDRFTKENLYFGVVIQDLNIDIKNAENSSFIIEKVHTNLNINLESDDFE